MSETEEVAASADDAVAEQPEAVEAPTVTATPEAAEEAVPAADEAVPAADEAAPAADDAAAEPAPVVVSTGRARSLADRPIITVGRRKQAVVRVRILPGTGQFTLNGRTLDAYFPNKVHQQHIKEPLTLLEKAESYDIIARLQGGGVTGQAGALQLGIARALIEVNPDDRPAIKKAGFLTRDARVKERKKYGLHKARKAPQYSKR